MKKLLITTALIELTTGLLLIPFPSVMATILFGSPIDSPVALIISRVAGVALISMGIACWLARDEKQGKAVKGLVTAMTVYNIGVISVLLYAGLIAIIRNRTLACCCSSPCNDCLVHPEFTEKSFASIINLAH